MLASAVIAFGMVSALPNAVQTAANLSGNFWLGFFYQNLMSLPEVIVETAGPVFLQVDSTINAVFWTMRYELIGSFAIYFYYAVFRKRTALVIPALAILILLWAPYGWGNLSGSPIGLLLFEAWKSGRLQKLAPAAMLMIFARLWLGGQPYSTSTSLFAWLIDAFPLSHQQSGRSVGAGLSFLGVLMSPLARSLLCSAVPQFLGRISFGLYLLHLPLLLTALCAGYIASPQLLPMMIVLYVMTAFGLGYLFTRLVDEPVVKMLPRLLKQ